MEASADIEVGASRHHPDSTASRCSSARPRSFRLCACAAAEAEADFADPLLPPDAVVKRASRGARPGSRLAGAGNVAAEPHSPPRWVGRPPAQPARRSGWREDAEGAAGDGHAAAAC